MSGDALRQARLALGLTQRTLAAQAGVTRQLVATAEQGRHIPSVDAALRLATALGTTVEALFGAGEPQSVHLVAPATRALPVRAGRVGDRIVAVPLDGQSGDDLFAVADGRVRASGDVELAPGSYDGLVVAGCDPALRTAERLTARLGTARLVAFPLTTGDAIAALVSGDVHGCAVHGPVDAFPLPPIGVRRWELARWLAGVGYSPDLGHPALEDILAGAIEVAQRPASAACQQALLRAAGSRGREGRIPGPTVSSHLAAAARAASVGGAAVTMEPAALASGLGFIPLEEHVVELWVAERWLDHPGTPALIDTLGATRFRQRLALIGGYDTSRAGLEVAAA